MITKIVSIELDGSISLIYDDDYKDLLEVGQSIITRVSNVEPNLCGQWYASILEGPILGPFEYRREALESELKYLNNKLAEDK